MRSFSSTVLGVTRISGFFQPAQSLRNTIQNNFCRALSPARSPCAQSQELLAEGQVFEDEILSRTEGTNNPADEVSEPRDHGQNRIETSLHKPLATRSFSECTRF